MEPRPAATGFVFCIRGPRNDFLPVYLLSDTITVLLTWSGVCVIFGTQDVMDADMVAIAQYLVMFMGVIFNYF
jgi:hypothetical protein